jgi:hypothetical protein
MRPEIAETRVHLLFVARACEIEIEDRIGRFFADEVERPFARAQLPRRIGRFVVDAVGGEEMAVAVPRLAAVPSRGARELRRAKRREGQRRRRAGRGDDAGQEGAAFDPERSAGNDVRSARNAGGAHDLRRDDAPLFALVDEPEARPILRMISPTAGIAIAT